MGTSLAGLVVLDSHVWLWRADAPQRLSRPAARLIASADRVCISVMSVFELGELLERQRIRVQTSTRAWIRAALASVEPLPLTAEIALDAAHLRFSCDPFDRVIYATARAEGAPLITRDRLLHEFDPQLAVW